MARAPSGGGVLNVSEESRNQTAPTEFSGKLTVFVVPEGQTSLHRWHLPGWLLSRRVHVALAVLLMVGLIHYGFSVWQSLRVPGLVDENVRLRDEMAELTVRLESVENNLSRIETLDVRVRKILGLEFDAAEQGPGVGGPLVPPTESYQGFSARDAAKLRRLDTHIELAASKAHVQENNLQDLLNYFSEQRSQLSSTPSIWPVRGWVTSAFGVREDPFTGENRIHEGLDIAASIGTPIKAPADGIVTYVGARGGYGKVLTIDHGYGVITHYGHLSEQRVTEGQRVTRGDLIATVGNTGRSTGPHLHYEVLINGLPVNPYNYIFDD